MKEQIERVLLSVDCTRRVCIIRRNGFFVIVAEQHFENIYEGQLIATGWRPLPGTASYFADIEIAEREAHSHYPWLVA